MALRNDSITSKLLAKVTIFRQHINLLMHLLALMFDHLDGPLASGVTNSRSIVSAVVVTIAILK